MTEEEWLTGTDPKPMLEFLRGTASDRKLRLFACGCSRRVWQRLEEYARDAVATAEGYADMRIGGPALASARSAVEANTDLEGGEPVYDPAFWACSESMADGVVPASFYAATTTASAIPFESVDHDERFRAVMTCEEAAHASLLRCAVGNPFHPVAANPAWLTFAVVGLADAIYAGRAFDRLPVLADALEEAGCDHPDIFAHCRSAGPHARGCWVVDLVLGKS